MILPTELDAVAELLYWQYTRPQILRWDELPEKVQDYWRQDANMVLTFIDQFRLVRSRQENP